MIENYFNYFTEVEEYFVRKRGKNILISPLDWCLVELWKENGIPVHVVLRGIDQSFESAAARSRRSPTSLHYCHPAVMQAFEEYQEAKIGSHEDQPVAPGESSISREQIVRYLERLEAALERRPEEECLGAAVRIRAIKAELQDAAGLDPAPLDRELAAIGSGLLQTLGERLDPDLRAKLQAEVESDLKRYRKRLSPEIFRQLKGKYLDNRLAEHFALPEFSLLKAE